MEDGLAGGGPDIDADVESIGLVPSQDLLSSHLDALQQSRLFVGGGIEPRGNVPARDDQEMPGRHREAIPQAEELVCFEGNPGPVGLAEEAGVGHGSNQVSLGSGS